VNWQLWAILSAIFAKVGISGINSDYATFIRTLVIVAVLCVFLTISGQWQKPAQIPARSWVFLVLSGLATGASWLAYFRALQLGDAARVAPLDKLSVVLVALFAVLFLGEKLSAMGWLGIALIGSGVVLLSLNR